jgi:hypothetical protein
LAFNPVSALETGFLRANKNPVSEAETGLIANYGTERRFGPPARRTVFGIISSRFRRSA